MRTAPGFPDVKPVLLLLFVSAVATSTQEVQPLTSQDRVALVGYLNQQAEANAWFAEVYDGAATVGGVYQQGYAEGLAAEAQIVENFVPLPPARDPVEERHEYELIVVNALRVAQGLPPYTVWPTN